MRPFVEIDIEETHLTASGQRYRVLHEGAVIVESTKDPEHDAARELLARGADVDAILVARGTSARLGHLAATRTAEGEMHGPRTVAWVPYFGPEADRADM